MCLGCQVIKGVMHEIHTNNSLLTHLFTQSSPVSSMDMSFLNAARTRRIALTAAAIGAFSVASPALASADPIDDALRAIPSGQISCAQAERYWTSEADYNSKVAQANALALFDRRGPQIKAALARVDEAANRCGLKGGAANTGGNAGGNTGGNNNTGGNTGGGNTGGGNNAPAPAPAAPAPAPALNLVAPGTPSFTIEIPGFGLVALPDLYQIVVQFLGQFGIRI